MQWSLYFEMMKKFRDGAPLGDVATMKFAAFGDTPEHVREQMEALAGYAPPLRTDALLAMSPGTLGREYGEFLKRNKLEHLAVSDDVKERFKDNPYAIRYTLTHDLHHVITGFDTGIAGELGVAAFSAGQGVGIVSERVFRRLMPLYSVLLIGHGTEIRHNFRVGLEMGREASLVIGEKLEDWLDVPLSEVRARLGITDVRRAEIKKSKPSRFAKWLYKAFGQELPMPDAA